MLLIVQCVIRFTRRTFFQELSSCCSVLCASLCLRRRQASIQWTQVGWDGQRRTDGDCGQCLTAVVAQYGNELHRWWQTLSSGCWGCAYAPVSKESIFLDKVAVTGHVSAPQRYIGTYTTPNAPSFLFSSYGKGLTPYFLSPPSPPLPIDAKTFFTFFLFSSLCFTF